MEKPISDTLVTAEIPQWLTTNTTDCIRAAQSIDTHQEKQLRISPQSITLKL